MSWPSERQVWPPDPRIDSQSASREGTWRQKKKHCSVSLPCTYQRAIHIQRTLSARNFVTYGSTRHCRCNRSWKSGRQSWRYGALGTTEVYVPGGGLVRLPHDRSVRSEKSPRRAKPPRGEQSSTSKRPPVLVTCRLCVPSRPGLATPSRSRTLWQQHTRHDTHRQSVTEREGRIGSDRMRQAEGSR